MSSQKDEKTATAVPAIYEKTAALFADFPADQFNRLLPTLTVADVAGNFQKPRAEVVMIDPTLPVVEYGKVKKEGSGEVYQDKRMREGTVALTRRALQKFQHAGGLIFPPQLNKAEWNATSCFYQAGGALKKADGSLLIITASKLVDLELEELKFRAQAETRNQYREKDGKPTWSPEEIDAQVRRDLLQARENMVQNAETKAQNRVTRKAFALKDAYTIEELRKPFVLIRFDTAFDLSDPMQASMLMEQARQASGNLFPQPQPEGTLVRVAPVEVVSLSEGVTVGTDLHAGGTVSGELHKVDPLDEPAPLLEEDGPTEELMNLLADGYEVIKVRFQGAVNAKFPEQGGDRELALLSWRAIHSAGDPESKADSKLDPARLQLWAELTVAMEGSG